ncbi:MAG: hypothetical protein FJ255_07210 [Phycisphaerae bacterium]|nr:hypothetical protein [Phycisphaerae bacterium]
MPTCRLLQLHATTLEELRRRELVRSSNNPVADCAEHVAARALGLRLVGNPEAGHDAKNASGKRYQIKGRTTAHNTSRQLPYLRALDGRPFDYLVGVIFDATFEVRRACVMPLKALKARTR